MVESGCANRWQFARQISARIHACPDRNLTSVAMRFCRYRRRGFTLIELLVVISVIGLLVGMLLPAVQQVRESARRTECNTRLHNLVLALHQYEGRHGRLPAGSYTIGPSFATQSGWGWGAMILPDLEQKPIYDRIKFDYHNAVAVNRPAVAVPVPVFVCPSDAAPEQVIVPFDSDCPAPEITVAHGNFCGVGGVLYAMSDTKFAQIGDGLSNTLFLGERVFQPQDGSAPPYTSAWAGTLSEENCYISQSVPHLDAVNAIRINASLKSPGCFSSRHPGGAQFAMGDGAVRFLSENLSGEVFEALGTPSGGEAVQY